MRKFIANNENGEGYDSFLECILNQSFSSNEINFDAFLEFLVFGELYFEDTFLNGVKKKFTHQPYTLDAEMGFKPLEEEKINPLQKVDVKEPIREFLSFFEKRAHHLKNRNISVDLTGGIDSRLVATILHHFDIPFEAVFSLDSGSEEEAEIAQLVADKVQIKLHLLSSNKIDSQNHLDELFKLGGGCWDVLKMKSLYNTQRWRQDKGYDLVITGVGGELYKDFFWLQDFPFYNKKKPDLHTLVKSRMYPILINEEWLGPELQGQTEELENRFIQRLSKYEVATNSMTYDQIYYHIRIKEHLSVFSHATLTFLDSYSPLVERDLLKVGYNLPRSKRFFNRFHREIIGSINPEVAKIPTTEGGMSVSNNIQNLTKDIFKYGADKSKKLISKITQNSKNIQEQSRDTSSTIVENALTESISVLREFGILNSNIDSETIPESLKGRIITLGYVLMRLN